MSDHAHDALARAADQTPAALAEEVDGLARGLAIVAAVDALEHPDDERGTFRYARALVVGADVHRLARLATGLPAAQAHGLVEKLAVLGAVSPEVAQEAHLRLDRPAGDDQRHGKISREQE